VQRNFTRFKLEGHSNQEITRLISENVSVENILKRSLRDADGGYVMAGILGHGDAFGGKRSKWYSSSVLLPR